MQSKYDIASLFADSAGTDAGLICAFEIFESKAAHELSVSEIPKALAGDANVLWLHFNLSNARARHLLSRAHFVPGPLQEVFATQDIHRRAEWLDESLLVVISDLTFEQDSDPDEVAPLLCLIAGRFLITGRTHPLKTADELRASIRAGLRAQNGVELLTWILAHRTNAIRQVINDRVELVGEIEDEILAGNLKEQRVQLGRIRRLCARLRRHFLPERLAFHKLLQRRGGGNAEEHKEIIRPEIEEFSALLDDVSDLYERAKLLQEELSSRVAEDTGRSLYVIAILSAVFLPMTLITGIFGMNVAGMPGLHSESAFWWVALLIALVGAITAWYWRRRH